MITTKDLDVATITKQSWVSKIAEVSLNKSPIKWIIEAKYPRNTYNWRRGGYTSSYCVIYDSFEEMEKAVATKRKPKDALREYKSIPSVVTQLSLDHDLCNFHKYIKIPTLKSKKKDFVKPKATMMPIGKPVNAKTFIIKHDEWREVRHQGILNKTKVSSLSDPTEEVCIMVTKSNAKPVAVLNGKDHLVIQTPIVIGSTDYYILTLIDMKSKDYVDYAAEEVSI